MPNPEVPLTEMSKTKRDPLGTEIELKIIEKRINGITESVQSSRRVLIVMIVASSAILFTLWNSNFSRERDLAFDDNRVLAIDKDKEPLHVTIRRTMVDEWVKTRTIQVSLLGIRADVADLSITGSFALVVITVWYYYTNRKTYREINSLLTYSSERYPDNYDIAIFVYQGIAQNSLFTKIENEKIDFEDKSFLTNFKTFIRWVLRKKINLQFTDRLVNFIFHLPFWTIFIIVFRDLWALRSPSLISGSDQALGVIIWKQSLCYLNIYSEQLCTQNNILKTISPLFLIILFDGFALICAFYTKLLCDRCLQLADRNAEKLRSFFEEHLGANNYLEIRNAEHKNDT